MVSVGGISKPGRDLGVKTLVVRGESLHSRLFRYGFDLQQVPIDDSTDGVDDIAGQFLQVLCQFEQFFGWNLPYHFIGILIHDLYDQLL